MFYYSVMQVNWSGRALNFVRQKRQLVCDPLLDWQPLWLVAWHGITKQSDATYKGAKQCQNETTRLQDRQWSRPTFHRC